MSPRTIAAAAALIAAAVMAATPAGAVAGTAVVRSENRVNTQVLDLALRSPSTEQNRNYSVRVLVPSGWSKTSANRWPVLYLLHGGFDDWRSWSDRTTVKALAAQYQVMVVMPDTSWCSAYTDWWNYGWGGRPAWETYVAAEIPALLESAYRASTSRAVAGNSMGGLGAMKFAANHGTKYRAAASFSGDVDPLHQYAGGTGVTTPGLGCLADWKRVWGDPNRGQLDIWQRNNPWNQAEGLRGKWLYLSSGQGDMVEQQVDRETRGLEVRLGQLGIPHVSNHTAGGHNWDAWNARLIDAWPGLMQAIGAARN